MPIGQNKKLTTKQRQTCHETEQCNFSGAILEKTLKQCLLFRLLYFNNPWVESLIDISIRQERYPKATSTQNVLFQLKWLYILCVKW